MNGGVNVLNTIYELVKQPKSYPVVIVQNSGRIADVVAYGLRNYAVIGAERDAGRRHDGIWQMARDVLYDKYGPIFGGNFTIFGGYFTIFGGNFSIHKKGGHKKQL